MHEANTGLSYSGARYYDPTLGRFISTDPVGFKSTNPMTFNRYDYADNNPYRYIDPTGDFSWPSFMNDVEGFNNYIGANRDQIELGILTLGVAPAAEAVDIGGTFVVNKAMNFVDSNAMKNIESEAISSADSLEKDISNETYLYQKVGANGEHLKFGITKNPATRYTRAQLAGGRLKIIGRGSRQEMLSLERDLHENLPIGPEEGQQFYIQKQIANGLIPPPYSGV